jgi:hypothetical protein
MVEAVDTVDTRHGDGNDKGERVCHVRYLAFLYLFAVARERIT